MAAAADTKKRIGEEYDPPKELDFPQEAGDTVPEKHPIIDNHSERLVS